MDQVKDISTLESNGREVKTMNNSAKTSGSGIGKRVRAQFIAGIVVVVPIGASILILVWLFSAVDNILQPLVKAVWDHTIPGVGFGATVALIYLVGVIARNVLGKGSFAMVSPC